jgi:hypothetical protein
MKRLPTQAAALLAAGVLTLSACGSNNATNNPSSSGSSSGSSSRASMTMGAAATKTPAAELRAGLTDLLTQHVYLAAIALKTAVDKGGDLKDPAVTAAVKQLDANSVALSKAVGSVYPDAEKPFLESWRQHIGFFVDYTLGKATGNMAQVDKARKDLDGYRTSFGQLINSVIPQLSADAVAKALIPHVQSLESTIDSLVAGDGKGFTKLVAAADHMPMTAETLAGGIVASQGLEGEVDGAASQLRSGLTYLLDSHVDLAGIALAQAVQMGGSLNDPSVKAAVAAVDANSVALSKAIGSVYPDAEKPFLESWRQHIGYFVDYTLGKATGNMAQVDKAEKNLDAYRTSFGQLINSVVPELPAAAVAKELIPHVDSVYATIDALVAGDTLVYADLAAAANHMPMTAAVLAGGIADNKHLE